MALFKINSGNEEDLFKYKINESTQQEELAVPFNPGWAYFSPDTGNFFIDSPLKDGTTLTKENIKEYRIQLNANKADFLLKETNNAGIYEIQPEKGVLQTNPIEQFSEILNDGEYVSKAELNTILSRYLLINDLPTQLNNYITKNGNNEITGVVKMVNNPIEYTAGATPISSTNRYYRPILVSTSAPTNNEGKNGDIWIVREN